MSPRLDRMSLGEIERGGERFYAAKGRRNGEDDEPCYCAGCDREPDDTLQPWEVYDPDDEIIADPPERD